jgi:peptide/nickel transport system substrate-binding protein
LAPAGVALGAWPFGAVAQHLIYGARRAEVAAWFAGNTFEAEKAAVRRLNKAAFDHVVYALLGLYLSYQVWRKNVSGIVKGPLPFFWGVSRTA